MSHTIKIFLTIIHKTIYKTCEEISNSQFGFRQGLGTRDALVATQVLIQNCYDQSKDVRVVFKLQKTIDDLQQLVREYSKLMSLKINTKKQIHGYFQELVSSKHFKILA